MKILPPLLLLTAVAALAWSAMALGDAEAGCRWRSDLPRILGIAVKDAPAGDETVRFIDAVVTDPQPLFSFGLFGAKPGDAVKMICEGNDVWRIKHYATGLAIDFSLKPPDQP